MDSLHRRDIPEQTAREPSTHHAGQAPFGLEVWGTSSRVWRAVWREARLPKAEMEPLTEGAAPL